MKFYVYFLYDPKKPTEARYVGQTSMTLKRRVTSHFSESRRRYKTDHSNYKCNWIGSLLESGIEPEVKLIEEVSENNYEEKEKFWISHYRNLGHRLTNFGPGGKGPKGVLLTEIHKQRLSESALGHVVTPETREKLRKSHLGKKHSVEHRMKLSAIRKGRHLSEATKAKISLGHRGIGHSEETKLKLRNFNIGKTHSEECKKKMSAALKGRKFSYIHRLRLSEANRRRIMNEAEKERLRNMSLARKGISLTEEHRKKITSGLIKYNEQKQMAAS